MFPGGKIPGEDWIFSWYTIFLSLGIGLIFGLRNYMRGPQCMSEENLEKKNVIVTGANRGIGLEVAKELARRGARVFMGCRDEAKGKAAVEEVKQVTQSKRVWFIKLDLSSQKSIRDFVEEFKSNNRTLKVLVNNAGVMYHPPTKTEDGHEIHFAVNYLGHYLLTHLLLDMLEASGSGRIINVTCPAYQLAELKLDDLNFENREFSASDAFSQSKLSVVLFSRQLAKFLEGRKATSNVVHPGICYTDIYANMPFMKSMIIRFSFAPVLWFMMKGAKDGAQTIVQCALAKEEEGVNGKFYADCQIKEPDEKANDDETAEKLWNISAKLTGVAWENSS